MDKQELEQELKNFETEIKKTYSGITKMRVSDTYPSLGIPIYDITIIYPDMKKGEYYNTLQKLCIMLTEIIPKEVCNYIFGICIKQAEEVVCYCLENGEFINSLES